MATTVIASARSIPFHKAFVDEEEAQAVADVVRSGWLTMGPRVIEFEQQFADYVGARHAIAVCSGTAALHLGLEAAGIRESDEVLVPVNTFTATAEAVTYLGARPVLVDIDPVSLNIDPEDARRRITTRTKAIIPVHLGGQPCDMGAIHALAREFGLRVVEDAAHALPAAYNGTPIGRLSELTAFSFYATKPLSTGEGGMITTDDDSLAERMQTMRLHGIAHDAWKRYRGDGSWYYEVREAGYKYNQTDLQAALGLVQLRKCDRMNRLRRRIAERYTGMFRHVSALQPPAVAEGVETAWHLYILRLNTERLSISRDEFIGRLKERRVGTSVHFIPLNHHPFYQNAYGYRRGDFPTAEHEFQRYLSLPIYPGMSESDIDYVIAAVLDIVREVER